MGNEPQHPALLNELKQAACRRIVVVKLTQCLSGRVDMDGYATGNALARAGVLSGFDMTVKAALTKRHFLLSQASPNLLIRHLMQQDLRGELSQFDE